MAATYNNTLPTNEDKVRFLIPDTDTTSAFFEDEEITAALGMETATGAALPYFTAARLVGILRAKWGNKGQGLTEKEVSKLRLRYGSNPGADGALAAHERELRKRGAWLLSPSSKIFKAL